MVGFVLSIILWVVDGSLGIVFALFAGTLTALDADGSYTNLAVGFFIALAFAFVRKSALDIER